MNNRVTISIALMLNLILAVGPLAGLAAAQRGFISPGPGTVRNLPPKPAPNRPSGTAFSARLLNKRPSQGPSQPGSLPGQTVTALPDGRLLMLGGLEQAGPVASVTIQEPNAGHSVLSAPSALMRARAFHSATMLPDGKVLVIGGIGLDGQVVDSAEIFDPVTQASELLDGPESKSGTPSSQSPTARVYHTATLLTEGLVLIAGGLSGDGEATRSAELWDYKTKLVVRRLKLRTARYGHSASLLPDGRVLVTGGSDNGGRHLDAGELFDLARLRFSAISATEQEALAGPQQGGTGPYLAASVPADGARDVATDALLALRFSRPLSVASVNNQTVTLAGPFGAVEARIVPAEAGMLAFVTPKTPLLPDSTYTLTLGGATDRDNKAITLTTITFTTAHAQPAPSSSSDGEAWIPSQNEMRNGWRTNRPDSEWRSLPPLKAAPGVTAMAGQALTLNGKPLADVTVKVDDKTARTDATGRFLIENIQAGHRVLLIDGHSASTLGKTYGVFEAGVEVQAAVTNPLTFTIWMPRLDTAHEVRIPSPTTNETVITTPLIPGLEIHVPAGTVIRDVDGKVVKKIGITPVPLDRPPFPLPNNVYVPIYFTVQPGGAYVEVPRASGPGASGYVGARLIYPNYRREGSGTRFDFWHYDPDQKGWYVYGKGTVAQDQNQIVPDPGVAVQEFTGAMVALPPTAPPPKPACSCPLDGDPVDLASGLFVLKQTDLALPDVIPIGLTRTYRPQDTITRSFGIGATHAFEIFLIGDRNPWTYIELVLPDGARIHYNRISSGTLNTDAVYEHTSTPTAFYKSRITWDTSIAWNLKLKNGTVYTFRAGDGATVANQAGLLRVRDRYGNTVSVIRDASSNNLTRLVSPNGRYINFTYDSTNRVTQATDNIGRTVNYAYDGSGRLWRVTDAIGGVTEYTYDSSHRMLTVKDARGIVYSTNQYDSNGRVIQQTQADATTYHFAYTLDGNGNVTQTDVIDPRGNHRTVTFNSSGYALTDTRGCSCGSSITYERQAGSNFIVATTDALNRRTQIGYDSMGNLTSITRMAGTSDAVMTSFAYEPSFNHITSVTDPLSHTMEFAYDARGSLVKVTDALNNQTTVSPDYFGRPISVTDPLGNTTQFGYEGADLISVTNPLGQTSTRFVDSAGRVLSISSPLGQTARLEFDALNRLTRTIDPLQGIIQYSYDPNSNLLSVTDARGAVTSYGYDNMDRGSTRTDPLLSGETYQYDENGNLKQQTDRKTQVTSYTYDSLDRLSQVRYADNSTITYTYDAVGRVIQAADSTSGSILYSYDNLDRLTSAAAPNGAVSYTYDNANRRATMTVPGQATISYVYDNADGLAQITQGTASVTLGYDAGGRRTSTLLPNGVAVQNTYDSVSRLTGINYSKGSTSLGSLTYAYDNAGRRISVGGTLGRTGLPQSVASASYNAANRQTSFGSQSLAYDSNGNLTSDGTNTYTWNARDQLASISRSGLTASFQYDAVGRRLSKTVNGGTINFLYDGLNPVQEQSVSNANILTGGLDEFLQRNDLSGASYPLADALGSVLALTDSAGSISTQYTYDPFGGTSASGPPSSNSSKYAAREDDSDGLYFYRARYYSPGLGRFISEDPLGLRGGINLYAYVADDPIGSSDPSGMERPSSAIRPFWTNPGGPTLAAKKGASFDLGAAIAYAHGFWKQYRDEQRAQGKYGAALLGGLGYSLTGSIVDGPYLGAPIDQGMPCSPVGEAEELITVGRWMSQAEYDAMVAEEMVQEGRGGITNVASPSDPTAFRAAPPGDFYVEFDVPASCLKPKGPGWAYIDGPSGPAGRLAARKGAPLPTMPPARNINRP